MTSRAQKQSILRLWPYNLTTMNQSEHNKTNPIEPGDQKEEPSVETYSKPIADSKPTLSKREIMEELSRQRFPWEE